MTEGTDFTELLPPARRNFTADPGPGTPREGTTPSDARWPTPVGTTPVSQQPCAPPSHKPRADVADVLEGAGADTAARSANPDATASVLSSIETPEEIHAAPKLVLAAHRGDSSQLPLSHRWLVDSGATVTIVSTPE